MLRGDRPEDILHRRSPTGENPVEHFEQIHGMAAGAAGGNPRIPRASERTIPLTSVTIRGERRILCVPIGVGTLSGRGYALAPFQVSCARRMGCETLGCGDAIGRYASRRRIASYRNGFMFSIVSGC